MASRPASERRHRRGRALRARPAARRRRRRRSAASEPSARRRMRSREPRQARSGSTSMPSKNRFGATPCSIQQRVLQPIGAASATARAAAAAATCPGTCASSAPRGRAPRRCGRARHRTRRGRASAGPACAAAAAGANDVSSVQKYAARLPRPQAFLDLFGILRRIGGGAERFDASAARTPDDAPAAVAAAEEAGDDVGTDVRMWRTKSPRISSCPHFSIDSSTLNE